jgi:hypothetical protein
LKGQIPIVEEDPSIEKDKCPQIIVGPGLLKEVKIKEEKVKCELHERHSD